MMEISRLEWMWNGDEKLIYELNSEISDEKTLKCCQTLKHLHMTMKPI